MPETIKSLRTQELDIRTLVGVVNQTGAYIYSKDLNGSYTYANQLVQELFACPLSEIVGKKDEDFFDLANSPEVIEGDRAVLENGETIEREEVLRLKSARESRIYMSVKKPLRDDQGNITGLFGISTDITKRKRLEINAHEQKEFLDIILNNVDANIFMKDSNRVFRYVNSRFANLFNLLPEEVIGRRASELMPQESADLLWELDQKLFDTNTRQTGEQVFLNSKGEKKRYLTTKIPFQLDDGTRTSISFSTDITELHVLKGKTTTSGNYRHTYRSIQSTLF